MNNAQKLDMDVDEDKKESVPSVPEKSDNTEQQKQQAQPRRASSKRRTRSSVSRAGQETPQKRARPLIEEKEEEPEAEKAMRAEAMRQADREILEAQTQAETQGGNIPRVPSADIAHPDPEMAEQLRQQATLQTPLDTSQQKPISDAEKIRIQEPLQSLHPTAPMEGDAVRHHGKKTKPGELQQTKRKEEGTRRAKKPTRTKITTNTEDKPAVKHVNAADADHEEDQRPENSIVPAENDQIHQSKLKDLENREQAVITDDPQNSVVSKDHFDALMRSVNTMHQELRLELSKLAKQQHELMLKAGEAPQKVSRPEVEYPLMKRQQSGHVRFKNPPQIPKQLRMRSRRFF